MHRVILIFDMNSFFASVELLARPDLVGKPIIIGQIRRRRVVCTATPEARKFGVKKGMPTLIAAKLCPNAIWLPVRKLAYEDESDEILKVTKAEMVAMHLDPAIETVGLDEAYLDLTPYCQGATPDESLNKAKPIAERLKAAILNQRKLHCKIGIASNKMMAKIVTDRNSSDGINIIYEHEWSTILPSLDVNEIPGVGEVTEELLKNHDPKFETLGDIQRVSVNYDFTTVIRENLGRNLWELAHGRDTRPVKPDGPPQSFGREETFEYDTSDMKVISPVLAEFASELEVRLKKFHYAATVIKVSFAYADRKKHHRQKTYRDPIISWVKILTMASEIIGLKKIISHDLYSIGVSVAGFVNGDAPEQIKLF